MNPNYPNYRQQYYNQQAQNQPYMPQPYQNQYQNQYSQQQNQSTPTLQGVQFATFDEVKSYIVPPNTRLMFMDTNEARFYIKTADHMGISTLEAFKFERLETNKPVAATTNNIVLDDYVKRDEMKQFATYDQLENIRKEIESLKGGTINGESTIQPKPTKSATTKQSNTTNTGND